MTSGDAGDEDTEETGEVDTSEFTRLPGAVVAVGVGIVGIWVVGAAIVVSGADLSMLGIGDDAGADSERIVEEIVEPTSIEITEELGDSDDD